MITDLADEDVLTAACSTIGLDVAQLVLLKKHATSVYVHELAGVVVRINRGKDIARARTAVTIAKWLVGLGFPATAPLDVTQPLDVDDASVTFWRYYPQHDRPTPEPAALGALLRELHQLSEPPVALDSYRPLTRLGAVLERTNWLDGRGWLIHRRSELLTEYERITSELGEGFIHGDAYPGNTLWDGDRAILGDWDEVACGPRELDLAFDTEAYKARNTVERSNKLKGFRAVAMRTDKREFVFRGTVDVASIKIWLRDPANQDPSNTL